MKKNFLISILFYLGVIQLVTGQTHDPQNAVSDPFCQMVLTINSIDALRFNACLNKKNVFETDTIKSYAEVMVKKHGNQISYLHINPEDGEKELLYCNDSAWVIDHQLEKMTCIGTNISDLVHNDLSQFFSFTIFDIDTLITRVEPFWKVIAQTTSYTIVSVDMKNNAQELSDIRAEYTIGNPDHLLYRTLQEVTYLKADQIYQEQIFSDYSFPDPGQLKIPEYFTIYEKDLEIFQASEEKLEVNPDTLTREVFLENIQLSDLSGHPFRLPQEGLIFFDCWYVGCAPCMKSAPVIEQLYQTYKDQVYFLSVNEVDRDTAKINRFCEKMGITFPVLIGGNDKIAPKVTMNGGYPVFFLLDAESGKVLWNLAGFTENLEDIIREAIRKNL